MLLLRQKVVYSLQLRGIGYVQKHYDDFNFHKSSDVVGMIICAA